MRLYRALLHVYPASFRATYGAEMAALFARRRADAPDATAAALVWLEAVADVAHNAPVLHWEILRQDLRDALRSLSRARGFSITAILVAALGIGATTAAFAVADHVLLRPLPFPEPHRLVRLWQDQTFRGYPRMELSPSNFLDWKRLARSFTGLAVYTTWSVNLVGEGPPSRLEGAMVSADLFSVLRVQAALGRTLTSVDDLAATERAVVLSDALWRAKFGGDGNVLGRTVVLNGDPHVVVGVMPARFGFPARDVEFWVPFRFTEEALTDRSDTYLNVVGRVADGVSLDQARAEMRLVAAQLERAFPKENAQTSATVHWLRDQVSGQARTLLIALVGAALCMLLIGCTNLANLLLARGLARQKEIAVRAAIGAGRQRLLRQTLTESLVLAGFGGAFGVLLAVSATPVVSRLVPHTMPIAETPGVDMRMLALAALVTLTTGIVFGLLPALRTAQGADAAALRESSRTGTGRRTERVRAALVVAAVAASVVLLVTSGLLIRALSSVQQIDPGFRTDDVLTLRTALSPQKYGPTERRQQFLDRVIGEIEALPGVSSAAYISYLPMTMRGGIWPVILDPGRLSAEARTNWAPDPTETRVASLRFTTAHFFATLGIPVLRGRGLSDADTFDSPWVAVVSQSFVDQNWPGQDPLGRQFFMAFRERTVVGVVGDVRVRGLERESEPQVYLPSRQMPDDSLVGYMPKDLAVHAAVPPATLVPAIRQIIARADPEQPVSDVRMLAEVVEADIGARRVQVRVLAGFAALAFLLAGIGLHGLLAFAVTSRTREIGLRMAFGARGHAIVGMVLRRGLWLALIGVACGVAIAAATGRALQSVLAGVSPTDVPVFAAAVILALVMTLGGCLWPAVRAVRIDPMAAIRDE